MSRPCLASIALHPQSDPRRMRISLAHQFMIWEGSFSHWISWATRKQACRKWTWSRETGKLLTTIVLWLLVRLFSVTWHCFISESSTEIENGGSSSRASRKANRSTRGSSPSSTKVSPFLEFLRFIWTNMLLSTVHVESRGKNRRSMSEAQEFLAFVGRLLPA